MARKSNDWTGMTLSDGRYAIAAKLGEGGMGLVYRARDTRLGMDVVIKVPRQAMLDDPEFSGRFAREIRSLVKLSHPCIVKVTDVGQQDGLPFAIMQYLSGGSLEDRLVDPSGRAVAVDPITVPGWLQGVASALDYVHSQGFVHRDVKPGNILFDSQGYSFLGDFGVIKALAASEATRSKAATGAGLVLGTPEYMAPELIMGGKVDGRADQYALAVTVYEALCGRRPFEATNATALLVLQTTQAPVPVTELRPNLPDRLSRAVLKGMAKDPSQRHANCAALATAVVAALEASPAFSPGRPPAATPASSESMKVLCPSCGKKIAMSLATYNNLKRTGKSFTCPACQGPVQVASEKTQVLAAPTPDPGSSRSATQKLPVPSPDRGSSRTDTQKLPVLSPEPGSSRSATQKLPVPVHDPGSSRSGTQKLPALDHAETSPGGPAGGSSPTIEEIDFANVLTDDEAEVAPRDRVKTPIVGRPRTQLLPQGPVEDPDQPMAKPSWLPWAGVGATLVLLLAVTAYALALRGARDSSAAADPATVVQEINTFPEEDVPTPLDEMAETVESDPLETPTPAGNPSATLTASTSVEQRGPFSPPSETGTVERPAPVAAPAESLTPVPVPITPAAPETTAADPASKPLALVSESTSDPSLPSRAGSPTAGPLQKPDIRNDNVTLTEILTNPEKYGGQELSPKGVFRTARLISYPTGVGTPTIKVMESGMSIRQLSLGNYVVSPIDGGRVSSLEIDSKIAEKLIANQVASRNYTVNDSEGNWLNRVAKLNVCVLRDTGTSTGTPWICRIVRIDFLIGLNAPRISEHKYSKAFGTYTVTPDVELTAIANGDDWQKRLGSHFIVNLGKAAKFLKTQQSLQRSAAFNMAISSAINRSIAASAAANAAREAATQRALTPGPPPNVRTLFNQEVELNAELAR